MKVSIIVPIYNGERYLNKCIDSIISQTYKNIELILINDGSTDKSNIICDNWANRDSRIRVFHRQNNGASSSRNYGILVSKGDIIQFVDCDDWIQPSMTENLLNSISFSNNQLAICGYSIVNNFGKILNKVTMDGNLNLEMHEFLGLFGKLLDNGLLNSPCNKIYKKEILVKNNIFFDEKLSLGEDLLFNLDYFGYIDRVSLCAEEYYNYQRINSNSLTKRYSVGRIEVQTRIYDAVKKFLINNRSYNGSNKVCLETHYTRSMINALMSFILNDNSNIEVKKSKVNEILNSEFFYDSLKLSRRNKKIFLSIFLLKRKMASTFVYYILCKRYIKNLF
jgi:glycosyltransferase involved in cell wall biosynthesis